MSALTTSDLQQIFQDLDRNCDGHSSVDELNWHLERTGVHLRPDELESSLGKSTLSFDEFLVFFNSISVQNDDEDEEEGGNCIKDADNDLLEAFNVFDLDGDGFISCIELQAVLKRLGLWNEKSGKDPKTIIGKYDTNFDGMVDFEEFKNMMLHNSA